MATNAQLQQQINELTTRLNSIEQNSKSISDLTEQVPLLGTSEVALNGAEKTTIQSIFNSVARFNIVNVTSDYSANENDYVLVDTTTANVTITLPDATTMQGGEVNITKVDISSNIVTVDTVNSQTINGELTQTITSQPTNGSLVSDGANWRLK